MFSVDGNKKSIVVVRRKWKILLSALLFCKIIEIKKRFYCKHCKKTFIASTLLILNWLKNSFQMLKSYWEYRVLKRYWKMALAKDWDLNSVKFYRYYCNKKLMNLRDIKNDILSFFPSFNKVDEFYQEFLISIEYKDIKFL